MLSVLMAPTRRTARVGMLATLVAGLAACGGSKTPQTAVPTASPSSVSAEADAKVKVLAAYNGFIQTYVKNSRSADYQDPDLRKYVGDPLLGDVIYDLSQLNQGGLVRKGDLGSAPTVASVDLASAVKTAKVEDCLDSSSWETVDKATGKSVEVPNPSYPNQSKRTRVVVDAALYDDGRWLITKSTAQPGVAC